MLLFVYKLCFYFVAIFVGVYSWFLYRNTHWKRKNVFSPPWSFPRGTSTSVDQNRSLGQKFKELYDKYKHERFIGVYIYFFRALIINDIDLVKNVLQKDYHHFQGHGFHSNKKVDPMSQHLFNLEGSDWRILRTKLSPTFTSTKMRFMFDTLNDCSKEMIQHLNELIKVDNVIDIKDVVARLGTDVISSCAFGIDSNSFKNPNAEFRQMGKEIFEKDFVSGLIDMIALFSPSTMELFRLRRIDKKLTNFFYGVVDETMAYRKKNNIQRNDFLQLLINMKSDEHAENQFTTMELAAQVFVFFAAGFETSSTTVTFALYELAKNPAIRDKLVKEINDELKKENGEITYEVIHDMKYLTEVIYEALRMYPPIPLLTRRCTSDYKIPDSSVIIEKGTVVTIPVWGIQRDPDIYPNPSQFDPDRFNQENMEQRSPFTHLPFGEGPRFCIGSRFGMMQAKLALTLILKEFNVEISDKTQIPLQINPHKFLLDTEKEVFLKLSRKE